MIADAAATSRTRTPAFAGLPLRVLRSEGVVLLDCKDTYLGRIGG